MPARTPDFPDLAKYVQPLITLMLDETITDRRLVTWCWMIGVVIDTLKDLYPFKNELPEGALNPLDLPTRRA